MAKNITFSAEAKLIEKARQKAALEKRTLNVVFREWLARYVGQWSSGIDYQQLMDDLSYADAGRTFKRDELNQR